jgi:5-methylcytosine-specific restriction endonuclease McrA
LHHIVYRSQGGGHSSDNLVTVCMKCHRKFHDKLMTVRRINGSFFFHDETHWRFQAR